jgi:hypothetical protein
MVNNSVAAVWWLTKPVRWKHAPPARVVVASVAVAVAVVAAAAVAATVVALAAAAVVTAVAAVVAVAAAAVVTAVAVAATKHQPGIEFPDKKGLRALFCCLRSRSHVAG